MAQGYYEGYSPPTSGRIPPAPGVAGPGRVARLVSLTGAVLSVALLAGVGVWSYRLMVRDVTGVPVIRALAGPLRESPDDPGGRQAAYQGLAVNTVAAEGGAAGAAQSIALAPLPQELSDEDRSSGVLAARGAPITAPGSLALAAAPVAEVAPAPAAPQTASADPGSLQILPASVPGISRSPRPRARNATLAVARPAPVATTTLAAAPAVPGAADAQAEALLQELVTRLGAPQVVDVDPASLTPGTRLVQLGAYDDEAAARDAWQALTARFPSYLENRGRIVESASAGGRVFYRLRAAGFADEPEARRFCSVLLADNVDCIPVLIR